MKKNKGFTLIELVAVIVILAIIALIATPIIINIIGDAETSSSDSSIDLYEKAVELAFSRYQMNNPTLDINNGDYSSNWNGTILTLNDTVINVEYSGQEIKCDINYNNGKVAFNNCIKVTKTPTTAFEADSWATIFKNIKNGNTSDYKLGDTKEIFLNGFENNNSNSKGFVLRIANISTPIECKQEGFSQTACGFVVEFVDIVTTSFRMNLTLTSIGGWETCRAREYINNDIYNALPIDLQNVITETKVVSGHGANDQTNFVTLDKLYLLSSKEVFNNTTFSSESDTATLETRQLDFYENKNVRDNKATSAIIKYYNGSAEKWWLRTASSRYDHTFSSVSFDGRIFDGLLLIGKEYPLLSK